MNGSLKKAAEEVLKDWPDDKPIGKALEDIEGGDEGMIELSPEFVDAIFRRLR